MPTPITFDKPELGANELFKQFDSIDALGTSYLDLHGKVSTGSIDLLPEDMRKDPAITPYKSLSDLARGLVETKKMVGSIEKAPEKPDGYKFTALTGLHPQLKAEDIQKQLMPIAHAAGVGQKAADIFQQGLLKTLSGMLIQQETAKKEAAQKAETLLRSEWGADYDARLDKITNTLVQAGGKEILGETESIKAAMKGSPNFLKAMGKLVSFLSEDSLKLLGEGGDRPITDAAGAQAEIDKYAKEIAATGRAHAYYDDRNPKHEEAVKKMHELFALLAPK